MYNLEVMFCQIDKMCYRLHFNIGVSKVLLHNSLQRFGLIYGQENHHNKLGTKRLLLNRALPIGTWLRKMVVSISCANCHLLDCNDSKKHCLWNCMTLNGMATPPISFHMGYGGLDGTCSLYSPLQHQIYGT